MTGIPHSVTIVGELCCEGDLMIQGRVTGTIEAPEGLLTIGPDARINGEVRAREVDVYGSVRATIVASQRIELAFSASVTGNLSADHVVLSDGARFSGRIDMNRRTMAHSVERFRRMQSEK